MVVERKPTVWEEMVGLAPPKVPGIQPITTPQFITTPTGWIMTPDYGFFISPLGEQFTLAEMQIRLPELGFEGVVYDWTRDMFVPVTAEQVAQRQRVYATMTAQLAEITPTPPKWGEPGFLERNFVAEALEKLRKVGEPGIPGAISLEEYESRIAEYNTMLAEQRTKIETAFETVFPGITIQDFQQMLTGMVVSPEMTEEEKAEAERAQSEFLTSLQQIGRTPETEFLLQTIFPGATAEDINELLGEVVPALVTEAPPAVVSREELKDIGDTLRSKEGMLLADFEAIGLNKTQERSLTKPGEFLENVETPTGERRIDIRGEPTPLMDVISAKVQEVVNRPFAVVAGVPISAETIVGLGLLAYGAYVTVQALFNVVMEASIQRNLNSYMKSAGLTEVEVPKVTQFNLVRYLSQNLSKKFLTVNAIKTLFNPTKAGWTLNEIGARAVEQDAQAITKAVGPLLVPLATQTGAMTFGGLVGQPITSATWAIMSIPDRVAFAVSKGLAGAIGSKTWEALTTGEIAKLQTPTVPPVMPVFPIVKTTASEWNKMSFTERQNFAEKVGLSKDIASNRWDNLLATQHEILLGKRMAIPKAEGGIPEVAPEVRGAYEAQAEIEGYAYLETDPVAQYRFQMGTKIVGKGETRKVIPNMVGLDSLISIREQSFPDYFTVKQAQALNPTRHFAKYTQKGLPSYNKVPRDEALDEIAEKLGYPVESQTETTLGDRVMQIRKERQQIKELQAEITTTFTEKPLVPQTDLTAKEVTENWLTMGQPKLNMKQVNALVSVFAEYIEDPTTINAWELTREVRRETRIGRAENLKARAQELVVSQGITTEEAMNQAIKETLSGELPAITTQYFEGITNELRDAFFIKVYHVLKDEPYEMASTVTALTNALMGKPIPREPGVKGGSAYTRLQRVFGDQPKVLKAIDKMASEKKPLSDVAETIYQVIGGEAIPIDQETADYLRGLQDIPYGVGALGEKPTDLTVSDLRSPADVEYAKAKLELLIKLSEGKITKDAYDIELALAKEKAYPIPPVTKYEAPIEDAIRQVPLWPAPARDAVIRILKEMAWSPVDIGGFIKAMKSSVDMSYWRQITPLIPNHKVRFALSNVDAWKSLFSQKSAEASWLRILHDPEVAKLYAIYDALQTKLGRDFLRPLDLPKGTTQWKGVEEFGYLTKNRLIPRLTAKIPWIKWSNRAFVTGTNSMSWGCFKDFYCAQLRIAEKYASGELKLKAGESFDIMDNMDAYATMLADWTGRAGLGKLATTAPILGNIFYAPRFALGRLLSPRHLWSSNPYVRREAWKDAVMFIGVIGGVLLLGRQLGFWDLETDRNSADFGKARIGNLRIDPWGGAQQFFVFFSRVFDLMMVPVTGKTAMGKSTTTGAEYPLNFMSLAENFFKSKEAPLAALFFEYITGKTYNGEKVDVKNIKQWCDRIGPMSIQDIWEGIIDQPGTWVIAGIFSFAGYGVQTYTGDWNQNIAKLGLPKYSDNVWYGMTEPVYDWADFYSDTASQFKGVDPATLTEAKGFDPKVRLIVETARSFEMSSIIPNVTLISMNADPTKGKTFADYYQIWQARQKIVASGDEKALKAFDADERNNQAYLGNISQSQFVLLTQYWSITDKRKQADFLEEHPELSQNPREEWLKSHPEDNAKQALAGKAKVLTQKAYDIAQNLIKDYDIPDNAVTPYLPPADIAKVYFERNDIVSKWGANSWEDKLLRAKNPELVEWLNKTGNPLGDVDTPIASLELKVKNRDLFDKLDAFSDEDSPDYIADDKARAEAINKFKTDNPEFVDDMRRIEAIEKGTNEAPIDDVLVNVHVEYGRLTDREGIGSSSAEVMLYRVDNPDYNTWRMNTDVWGDNALKSIDESRIPIWRIDVKYLKEDAEYQVILDKYEGREESARTKTYLEANPEYRDDRQRRNAYEIDFPENLIEDYVEWHTNPKLKKPEGLEGSYYEDDWWLMEHPEFHAAMVAKDIWEEPRDFSKVPSREIWDLYQTYQFLAGSDERLAFRIAHPDLDAWLVETKGYKPAAGRVRGEVESWREELARKLAELHRLIAEMKKVIPK